MDKSISSARRAKQGYLIDNIIKTGDDAEQFQVFLMERKEGGANIDQWSFEELKQLVDEFKTIS